MSEDAIQAMYQFDLDVLNSERAYVDNTQPIFVTEDDEDSVDFKRYEKAITVTDVYHETKNRFAWVGEIKNEHLLAALEKLNAKDLELLTLLPMRDTLLLKFLKFCTVLSRQLASKSNESLNF